MNGDALRRHRRRRRSAARVRVLRRRGRRISFPTSCSAVRPTAPSSSRRPATSTPTATPTSPSSNAAIPRIPAARTPSSSSAARPPTAFPTLTLAWAASASPYHTVASAGDFNGDGYSDLFVGANGGALGGPGAGQVLVYFGGPNADSEPDQTILGAPGEGLGATVVGPGDLNGDGYADLVAGAPLVELGGRQSGRVYVISKAPIDLVSPQGDEVWVAHHPASVEWRYSGPVDIDLSVDDGATWQCARDRRRRRGHRRAGVDVDRSGPRHDDGARARQRRRRAGLGGDLDGERAALLDRASDRAGPGHVAARPTRDGCRAGRSVRHHGRARGRSRRRRARRRSDRSPRERCERGEQRPGEPVVESARLRSSARCGKAKAPSIDSDPRSRRAT